MTDNIQIMLDAIIANQSDARGIEINAMRTALSEMQRQYMAMLGKSERQAEEIIDLRQSLAEANDLIALLQDRIEQMETLQI